MNPAHATILLGTLALALALNAGGKPTAAAGGFTELHRVEVAAAKDLEIVMGLVERPGESVSPKHYHPGGEFGFVIEGTATAATENEQIILKAGSSFYQPPGEWHVVSTGAEGARTVVFRVLKKGQPMIVAVD